jgi:hypothetical protein
LSLSPKALLAAVTDWRSLGVVVASTAATIYLGNPFIPLLGVGIFVSVVNGIMRSPAFQAGLRQDETLKEIRQRVEAIGQLAAMTATRPTAKLAQEAGRLAAEFLKEPEMDTPRQVLVGQALKLAELYLKIAQAQAKMADSVHADNEQAADLARRIGQREQRLQAEHDPGRHRELERALSLDHESLSRMKARLDAQEDRNYKLQSLESAFTAACQQFYSPDVTIGDDTIDLSLMEAEALYDALAEFHTPRKLRQ